MLARVGSLFIKMLVTAVLLPNYLGASLVGTYNYPLMFLAFFAGVCTLGTEGLVTRELLRKPHLKDVLLGSAFRLRLLGGLIALPLIYAAYFIVVNISPEPLAASFPQLAFVSLTCIIQAIQIIDSYFQSRAEGKYIMLVQIGGNMISVLFKALLVYLKAPIDYLIGSLVFDVLIIQLGYIAVYKKKGNSIFTWKYNSVVAKRLLVLGWPLALSTIFATIYLKIDQLMIGSMLGSKDLGVYSTVVQYSESWYFIPAAISAALFPAIMNYRIQDPILYYKRLSNLYELMAFISLSIAIIMTFITPTLFSLIYNKRPEFMQGIPVLQIHIWSGVFAFLSTANSQYLIAEGLTKISLYRTLFGAGSNILLNILLIPKYGILGAAYGTLIAYFITAFSVFIYPQSRQQGFAMLKGLFFAHSLQRFFTKKR